MVQKRGGVPSPTEGQTKAKRPGGISPTSQEFVKSANRSHGWGGSPGPTQGLGLQLGRPTAQEPWASAAPPRPLSLKKHRAHLCSGLVLLGPLFPPHFLKTPFL